MTTPRPCLCPGPARSRHLTDAQRAVAGLPPCPDRGKRTSGPPGKGNPQVRLPAELGELAARCADEKKLAAACEALRTVLGPAVSRDLETPVQ